MISKWLWLDCVDIDSFLYLITYSCGTAENKQLRNFNILAIPVTLLLIISCSPKSILTRGPEGFNITRLFMLLLIQIFSLLIKVFPKSFLLQDPGYCWTNKIRAYFNKTLLKSGGEKIEVNDESCCPILIYVVKKLLILKWLHTFTMLWRG